MFSFLFGRNSTAAVQAYLERIAFLMGFLEQYGGKPKNVVVAAMREKLLLDIPTDAVDSEDRYWPDPSNSDISISFRCKYTDGLEVVNQFLLTGFDALANTLIIGTAHGGDRTSFTWSASVESESRPVPTISRKVQNMFWRLPGYKLVGVGDFRFLLRE